MSRRTWFFVGVGFGVNPDPAGDFRKQVTGFELEEIGIDRGHAGGRLATPRQSGKGGGDWMWRNARNGESPRCGQRILTESAWIAYA